MLKQDLITRLALNDTFMEIITVCGLFLVSAGFAITGLSITGIY